MAHVRSQGSRDVLYHGINSRDIGELPNIAPSNDIGFISDIGWI